MRPSPCPVCNAPDGFHDEDPHSAARAAIPAELKRPSNSAVRRERRAGTVDGIRPHLPRTPEELKLMEDMARALLTPDAPELDR